MDALVRIVLLSGAVASGKSSLAAALISNHQCRKISTSGYLTHLAVTGGFENRRDILQALGDRLDEQSDYAWPIQVAKKSIEEGGGGTLWLLDAVRKQRQVVHFRTAFRHILHVHVTAPEAVLRARYLVRQEQYQSRDAHGTYDALVKHPNEVASRALEYSADIVFDSNSMNAAEMAVAVVQVLREVANGAGGSD